MHRTRPVAAFAALSLFALAAAAPAGAAAPPRCDDEVWSRPGLERILDIYCSSTDRVRVAEGPAHGAVTGESFDGLSFRFRLSTDEDSPVSDRLVLDLDGPAGAAQHTMTIHNVPLDQNTPPHCQAVNTAQRTDGLEPAVVTFNADCWDNERDDFTLYGSGPGTHLDAPLLVPGGRASLGLPSWRYRTAVSVGPEQTAYWAVDSQGARSTDAPISVQVGPLVDRLPTCRPNPADYLYDPLRFRIYTRSGATRRFGIICQDEDGDALQPRVAVPPLAGTLTRFDVGEPQPGWWGVERWVDAVYVPQSDREGEDRFAIVATGPRGIGPIADMLMTTRSLPANVGNGGCGYSGGSTRPGEPVTVEGWCEEEEGDPFTASIIDPPAHGTAEDPVVRPGKWGTDEIRIRYTPANGFEGVDFVTARMTDGHGYSIDLEFRIGVASPAPPPPPAQCAPGPDPDGWFCSPAASAPRPEPQTPAPSVGQARAISPADQARIALRTRSVRLVRHLGMALVFAPREPLKPAARVRALAVTCSVRCRVDSAGALRGAGAARRARAKVSPGRARALVLRLTAADRRRLRRARHGRARFRITVRPVTGGRRSGRVSLHLRAR